MQLLSAGYCSLTQLISLISPKLPQCLKFHWQQLICPSATGLLLLKLTVFYQILLLLCYCIYMTLFLTWQHQEHCLQQCGQEMRGVDSGPLRTLLRSTAGHHWSLVSGLSSRWPSTLGETWSHSDSAWPESWQHCQHCHRDSCRVSHSDDQQNCLILSPHHHSRDHHHHSRMMSPDTETCWRWATPTMTGDHCSDHSHWSRSPRIPRIMTNNTPAASVKTRY